MTPPAPAPYFHLHLALPVGLEPCSLIDYSALAVVPGARRGGHTSPLTAAGYIMFPGSHRGQEGWPREERWDWAPALRLGVRAGSSSGEDNCIFSVCSPYSVLGEWVLSTLDSRKGNRLKSSDLPTVLLLLSAQLVRRLWCSVCKPSRRTSTTHHTAARVPYPSTGAVIHIELVWFGFLASTHLHRQASFTREMGSSHRFLEGGRGGRSRQHSHGGFLTLTGCAQWAGGDALLKCPILQLWGLNSWGKEPPRSLGSAPPLPQGRVAKTGDSGTNGQVRLRAGALFFSNFQKERHNFNIT